MPGFSSGNGGCLWSLTPRRPALRNASGNQGMRTSVREGEPPIDCVGASLACTRPKGRPRRKKNSMPKKTRGGGALPRAKSTAKSEAKIRASRRTRPIVRCVSVAKASRLAAAARRQPKGAHRRSSSHQSPIRRRRDPITIPAKRWTPPTPTPRPSRRRSAHRS